MSHALKHFLPRMNTLFHKEKNNLLALKCYFSENFKSVSSLYSPYIGWLSPGTDTTGMEDTGRPVWDETLRSAQRRGAKTAPAVPTASCWKTKLSTLTDASLLLPRAACNHHLHQHRRHHQCSLH